jgi:CBS domain containing-hemolysin-like protein
MIEIALLVVALLLVLACGLFVAAEFAFVTVDRSRVERLAASGDRRATGVLAALKTLSSQLSGAQIGITITNLAIGFLAEPGVADLLRSPLSKVGIEGTLLTTVSLVLAISIATVVTMLFGELVPKNLAIARPVGTARRVQSGQRAFTKLMHYPILLTNGTANFILKRFLKIEPQEELASARSVDELLSVVKHSARRGTLAKDTAVLLERSLEFGERHASDVMTPRVKLTVVRADDPIQTVIEAVKKSGFSRFPVIDKEIDNIVGMIHVKNAVAIPFSYRKVTSIRDNMQSVVFVPSSIELDDLIERMRDESTEAVVTIDEFGGVDGLVTLEDLIEELVGEVKDEHDEAGIAIKQLKSRVWSVSGLLRPDEISQVIGLTLPEDEEFETIGGLVLDQWEDVPKPGDEVLVNALDRDGSQQTVRLKVTGMDGRRVDRIEITLLKTPRSDS